MIAGFVVASTPIEKGYAPVSSTKPLCYYYMRVTNPYQSVPLVSRISFG